MPPHAAERTRIDPGSPTLRATKLTCHQPSAWRSSSGVPGVSCAAQSSGLAGGFGRSWSARSSSLAVASPTASPAGGGG